MPAVTFIEATDVKSSEVSTSTSTEPTTTTTSTSIPISHVPVLCLRVTIVSSSESHTNPTSIAIASTSHSTATTVIASIELLQLPTPIFSVPSLRPPSVSTISTDPLVTQLSVHPLFLSLAICLPCPLCVVNRWYGKSWWW